MVAAVSADLDFRRLSTPDMPTRRHVKKMVKIIFHTDVFASATLVATKNSPAPQNLKPNFVEKTVATYVVFVIAFCPNITFFTYTRPSSIG